MKPSNGETMAASLIEQGERCYASRDFSRARQLFQDALTEDPVSVDALNNLGVISLDDQDINSALEYFSRALEIDPYHQGVVVNLGRVLPRLGRHEDALLIVDTYLTRYPEDREVVGLQQAIAGAYQQQVSETAKADFDSNRNHGLDQQARLDSINQESEPSGETIPERSFSSGESLSQSGEAAFARGDMEAAEQRFKEALAINPELGEIHSNLAVVYWEQGKQDAAMRHFTSAYELDPFDRNIVVNLYRILTELGHKENVHLVLNSYLQKYPDDQEIRQYFKQEFAGDPANNSILLSAGHLDSSRIAAYSQPPAGNTERFIEVQPILLPGSTISAYRAFEDYRIEDIGTGFSAANSIIRHILTNKLGCTNPRPADDFHNNIVVSVRCSLKDRATGQTFKSLAPASILDISAEFANTEGPERINKINEYAGLLREGIDLGSPMYITGTVLGKLGASCEHQHIYMIDGARRISAAALNHEETIDIGLICDQQEYANFLNAPRINGLKNSIASIPWFSGYQTIPLLGLEGERTAYRYQLMDLDILQNKVVMDFGCNTGQACIQACQSGAKKVYGIEGVAETFNAAQEVGVLAGFDNLEFLNVDFNDSDFDKKIDQACPGQVDYAFFFSVYRTKELTQREHLFKYIIEKARLGIFFEGHADPTIDTLDYYGELFDSFGLDYKYLGNSEGPLRPLFLLEKRSSFSSSVESLNRSGEEAFRRGDFDIAVDSFTQALATDPEFQKAHCNLGVVYWERGERVSAIRHFTRAYGLDPENRNIVVNIGEVLTELGQSNDAQVVYRTYLQRHPNDNEIKQKLGHCIDRQSGDIQDLGFCGNSVDSQMSVNDSRAEASVASGQFVSEPRGVVPNDSEKADESFAIPMNDQGDRIAVCVNLVPTSDAEWQERQNRCIQSVDRLIDHRLAPVNLCFPDEIIEPARWNVDPYLELSANVELKITDGKRKPFVSDVFNRAAQWSCDNGCGWFCYINNDIILTPKLIKHVRCLIAEGYETVCVSRNEVAGQSENGEIIPGYLEYRGFDAFFVSVSWWQRNQHRFQPYILGERAWDDAYTAVMMSHSKGAICYKTGYLYHYPHSTNWIDGPYADYNLYLYNGLDLDYQTRIRAFLSDVAEIGIEGLNDECVNGFIEDNFLANREPRGAYVNICMVTYNRLEFTQRAIESIVKHTKYPYVLTVVDNNSTDGTREFLQRKKQGNVIKNLILLDENIGVAKASNIAWLQEPDAGFYLKYDNDIVIQKRDWLANMVETVERVETLGAVAYNFESASYPLKSIDGCQIRPKENGTNLGGACILVPKRTEQNLGFWCEDYGLYGEEDADYGVRIALAGLVNAYMEDEEIGFHLPAGKAAVIANGKWSATDGLEEEMHHDYRQWKDQQRCRNMGAGGPFENNLRDYQTRAKSLYIGAGELAIRFSPTQTSNGGIENIESNIHQLTTPKSKSSSMADRPLRVAVFSLDYKTYACAKLRLVGPLEWLSDSTEYRWGVIQQSETAFTLDESAVDWADVFIVQRVFPSEQTQGLLDSLIKSGKPLIYETDDLLTESLPLNNPIRNEISKRIPYIQKTIANANLVTVSTEALKTEMKKYNTNVCVLPNLLDDGIWRPKPPKQSSDEIFIGYAGTATHGEDLAIVESALEKIANKYAGRVRFLFMGFATDRIRSLQGFQEAPFCEYRHYPTLLNQLPIDIAIAPLVDSRFNRGKSHVKWLEYSMCGYAGVYSDLPPYNGVVRNGETGLLAESDSNDWFDALVYLIENPEARQRIALAAQQEVVEHHTLATGSRDYLAAWGSVRTSKAYGTVTDLNPAVSKIDFDNPKALCPNYQKWLDKRALTEADAQLMAERMFGKWTIEPVLHLVMVVAPGQEALLANTLDSLDRQLYKIWGLSVISTSACPDPLFENLANVEWVQVAENPWQAVNRVVTDTAADWVMFIEPGDLVWPQGLFGIANAINRNPNWKFIYSDEDLVDAQYEHTAHCFKPDCNPELLRSSNYIGNACLVWREALDQAGGFTDFTGVQRHDAALKIMDQFGESAIGHIADILYSRLSLANPVLGQAVVDANTRSLLAQHLDRTGVTGTVEGGFLPGAFRVDYPHTESPKVSILLAAKDRIGLTEDCVETLIEHTDYPDYEILIADYGSEAEDTYDFYAELAERFPGTVRVIDQSKADNPSQAINQAANEATGDYLLMLAPNVTFVQSNWLTRLMQHAQRPGVGAVGPRIAGIDKTIRHAGYVLGLNGVASSAFQGLDLAEDGYLQRAKLEQNCMAISGACLLVDKELFKRAGGLDEANLKANFWDVNLCLKLGEMDQKVIWTPHASVVQQAQPDYLVAQSEDQAREFQANDEAWMTDRWREKIAHDLGYNKNLDLIDGGFTLEVDVVTGWDRAHHDRPRVMAFPLNSEGCGEYRVRGPMRGLKGTCRIELALLPNHASGGRLRTPSTAELLRAAPDVLLLQHSVSDCHIDAVRAFKKFTDTFLVYGTDDLMHKLPQKNSRRKQIFRDMKHRIRQVLGCCDRMIVSTQPLADAYGNMIDDIRVVPNYLEGAAWGQAQSLRRQGQKPRVGWAGACQHHGDLELIADVVKATANEVEWVFMGMLIDELKPYVKEFHEGVIFQQYPQKLASLNLDLAIAPLEINPFNEAKGNLRLLEYGMMGWPVVCSEIYPYHNAPVTRVKNNANEWINAIRERVHDLETAEKEGDFLKAWVEKNWMLEDHLDEWLDALTPISQISACEKVSSFREERASASR